MWTKRFICTFYSVDQSVNKYENIKIIRVLNSNVSYMNLSNGDLFSVALTFSVDNQTHVASIWSQIVLKCFKHKDTSLIWFFLTSVWFCNKHI